MLKRPIWRRIEKVNYAASVVGITLDGLPGQVWSAKNEND
jgi:hypothetical protein